MGNNTSSTGAFTYILYGKIVNSGGNGNFGTLGFNASLSNTIYNESKTVQPRSLVLNCIIKY